MGTHRLSATIPTPTTHGIANPREGESARWPARERQRSAFLFRVCAALLSLCLFLAGSIDVLAQSPPQKKKKSKKSTKSKGEPSVKPLTEDDDEPGPLVLRISRNKHWRYISSYHVCLPHLFSLPSCIMRE